MNNINEKVFIAACRKAGLNVNDTIGNKVAKGLVVIDGLGNAYSVNKNGKLVEKVETHARPVIIRNVNKIAGREAILSRRRGTVRLARKIAKTSKGNIKNRKG